MHTEITSLLGLEVYTRKGIFVGKVDDAVLDPSQGAVIGLAVGSVNRSLFDLNAKGVIIPYRWIEAVGDIILMRHISRLKDKDDTEKK